MTISNVLIMVAMEGEAAPFVKHLNLEPASDFFPAHVPFQAFTGLYNEQYTVTVVINGKDVIYGTGVDNCGTVPAALATYMALQKTKADLLINTGTAGGFARKGAEIGNVFVCTTAAHHDRRIPIPSFTSYGIGRLDSKVSATILADALDYKVGTCTTGNSLDKTEEDDKHMLANDAAVKDMELAAVAWTCALHDTPFLGVKVVTDIVDGDIPTQDEFLANFHTASMRLQEALPKVLDFVLGKSHVDL